MKHSKKIKLARKLRSKNDIKNHTPIFQTDAWFKRREQILKSVLKKHKEAHQRALKRKKL